MEDASPDQVAVFSVFVKNAAEQGAEIRMHVNDMPAEVSSPDHWPKNWRSVRLDFRKGALLLDARNNERYGEIVVPWAARFFGAVLSLLPVEPAEESETTGEEEGRLIETRVKRYERSHMNRAACIEVHGVSCKGCGMTFIDRYGVLGQDFIHVHHLEPLSMLDGPYILNPAVDLVPVCPNCHAMLHKRRPPFTVEELRSMLAEKAPADMARPPYNPYPASEQRKGCIK
jgi:5-methylcytosine-specific restriction protein A